MSFSLIFIWKSTSLLHHKDWISTNSKLSSTRNSKLLWLSLICISRRKSINRCLSYKSNSNSNNFRCCSSSNKCRISNRLNRTTRKRVKKIMNFRQSWTKYWVNMISTLISYSNSMKTPSNRFWNRSQTKTRWKFRMRLQRLARSRRRTTRRRSKPRCKILKAKTTCRCRNLSTTRSTLALARGAKDTFL